MAGAMVSYLSHKLGIVSLILSCIAIKTGSLQMSVGPYLPYHPGAPVECDAMVSYSSHKLGILCLIIYRHYSWLYTGGCGSLPLLPFWCTSGSRAMVSYSSHKLGIVSLILSCITITACSIQVSVGSYLPYHFGATVVNCVMVRFSSHKLGILCLIIYRHYSWLYTGGCGSLLLFPFCRTSIPDKKRNAPLRTVQLSGRSQPIGRFSLYQCKGMSGTAASHVFCNKASKLC